MAHRPQNSRLLVIKFGGTSMANGERIRRAALRVRAHYRAGRQVVVVVSAMGHTTDRLLRTFAGSAHDSVGAGRELDRALATGEDFAAATLAGTLLANGVRAVSLRGGEAGLLAVGAFGHGELHHLRRQHLEALLSAGIVPVVSGFQAERPDGQTVTLGRGGSDTTAVFLAGSLGAPECHIVTDVDGVFDDDPRQNCEARRYDELSFLELIRLVDAGAHVIHPKAARFARDFRVPLHVYSFRASPSNPRATIVGARCVRELEEAV
ncbi:MAG: amino acid kinase family protein [Gemmatimonadota bacterium]